MPTELLTGLFALAGVLLSAILALVGYRMKARHDLESQLRTRHFERRLAVYDKVCDLAGTFYQTGAEHPTLEEVRTMNKELLLVASPTVLEAFNRIFDTSADKLNSQGVADAEIREIQTRVARNLYNAIRVDLYPGLKPLPVEAIRFVERKESAS